MKIFPPDVLPSHDRIPASKGIFFQWPISAWGYVIVAILSLVLLILRMYAGGFISLTADEFGKAALAWIGLENPTVWFEHIWLPGHFPLLAAGYAFTGDLLIGSRLVSVLFGVVAIFAVYRLGYYLKSDGVGGVAAILMATSPLAVWLSATGLVDILYGAFFILGLSYYVQWQRSHDLHSLYLSCGLFACSCTFHYNAWLAVMAVGMLLSYDLLWSKNRERLHGVLGLFILALVPMLWCAWNWFTHGDPLDFLHGHIESSALLYEKWGAATPSIKNSLSYIGSSIIRLGPVLAVLSIASAAGVVYATQERQTLGRLWFVLLIFGGGLIVLFARGGLPTAYPERYMLVPLLIMTVLSAYGLSILFQNHDQSVRVMAGLFCGLALMTNLWLTLHYPKGQAKIQEAQEVADFLTQTEYLQHGKRVLLETKEWNHFVIGVFLNDPSLVIEAPNHLAGLLETEVRARRFAQERGIRSLGVWSEALRSHVEKWGLPRIGQVGSYTFYNFS